MLQEGPLETSSDDDMFFVVFRLNSCSLFEASLGMPTAQKLVGEWCCCRGFGRPLTVFCTYNCCRSAVCMIVCTRWSFCLLHEARVAGSQVLHQESPKAGGFVSVDRFPLNIVCYFSAPRHSRACRLKMNAQSTIPPQSAGELQSSPSTCVELQDMF